MRIYNDLTLITATNIDALQPEEEARGGGWLELEAEQALIGQRMDNTAGLVRPEKVLKPGAALDTILTLLGGKMSPRAIPAGAFLYRPALSLSMGKAK